MEAVADVKTHQPTLFGAQLSPVDCSQEFERCGRLAIVKEGPCLDDFDGGGRVASGMRATTSTAAPQPPVPRASPAAEPRTRMASIWLCQCVVLGGRQPGPLLGGAGDRGVHGLDASGGVCCSQLMLQELPEQRMDAGAG